MASKKATSSGKNLESTMKLIKETVKYIDGTATVSFCVSKAGEVSNFKLVADPKQKVSSYSTPIRSEYVPEDDGFNNFYGEPK